MTLEEIIFVATETFRTIFYRTGTTVIRFFGCTGQ